MRALLESDYAALAGPVTSGGSAISTLKPSVIENARKLSPHWQQPNVPNMGSQSTFHLLMLILLAGIVIGSAGAGAQNLQPVAKAELCVTEGSIEQLPNNQLQVSDPAMRAYLNATTPQSEEARFTYRGYTQNIKALGSGTIRIQFGLKLRAGDACNLVYVMWRIEPDKKIVVSVKRNPGQHTSAECGNRGYTNIKPAHIAPAPAVNPGETHTLRAEMNGATLQVFADGTPVWQGSVGADAAALPGPVGIRSDNAALLLELLAPPASANSGPVPACRVGEGD